MQVFEKVNFVQVWEGTTSATTGTQTEITYTATKPPIHAVIMAEPSESTTDDTALAHNFAVCPASVSFTPGTQTGQVKVKANHESLVCRVYLFF
jgi:hypothetical protein